MVFSLIDISFVLSVFNHLSTLRVHKTIHSSKPLIRRIFIHLIILPSISWRCNDE